MTSKILLITEGKRSEPKLFNKIIELFKIEEDISLYEYKSSIYSLYDYIKNNYDINDLSSLDIVNVLKGKLRSSNEHDRDKYLEMLSQKFTDIILIFDFEPHDPKFDDKVILNLSQNFKNETENGLLLINYPMHESYKHYKYSQDKKDESFIDLKVSREEWKGYKQLSAEYSNINRTEFLTSDIVRKIILAHSEKIEFISNSEKNHDKLYNLLSEQVKSRQSGFVYVVNTSLTFFEKNFSTVIFGES